MKAELEFNEIVNKVYRARIFLRFKKELMHIDCSYPSSSENHLYISSLIAGYDKSIEIILIDYLNFLETFLNNEEKNLAWSLIRSNVEHYPDIFFHKSIL